MEHEARKYCTAHNWNYIDDCALCLVKLSPDTPVQARGAIDTALDVQVGGGHYKGMAIQPVEYIHRNGIGYAEGSVIKYVSRWRNKNGIEDLKKARHFIDLLIELESAPK